MVTLLDPHGSPAGRDNPLTPTWYCDPVPPVFAQVYAHVRYCGIRTHDTVNDIASYQHQITSQYVPYTTDTHCTKQLWWPAKWSSTAPCFHTGLPLSGQKKIPGFSRRNFRQHIEQMHIYRYKIRLLRTLGAFQQLTKVNSKCWTSDMPNALKYE